MSVAKASFVHGPGRKTEEKKRVPPVVLASVAAAAFLLLAPFGFDLGKFADALAAKPAFAGLARALRAADAWYAPYRPRSGEDEYRDMYTAREGDLTWKSALTPTAGGARDGVNPEALVDGGKDLAAANDAKGPAQGPRALQPDETKGKDPIVPVNGPTSAGGLGGPVGGVSSKDSTLELLPSPIPPEASSPKTPPRGRRPGRSSSLSGRSALVVGGEQYRYGLGVAAHQVAASRQMGLEDSALWARAWATGEKSKDGVEPQQGSSAGPTPANPDSGAGGGGFAGAMDTSMGQCASVQATFDSRMAAIRKNLGSDKDTLVSLGAPNSRPSCCDHGAVRQWNDAVGDEQNLCGLSNQASLEAQKGCASLAASADRDCTAYGKDLIRDCGDSECLVTSTTEKLRAVPVLGNVFTLTATLAVLAGVGLAWLWTAGQAGGALGDLFQAAGDAAANLFAFAVPGAGRSKKRDERPPTESS